MTTSLNTFTPMTTFQISPKYRHDLSDETKLLMADRDKARLNLVKGTQRATDDNWKVYTRLRNKCTKMHENAKKRRSSWSKEKRLLENNGSNVWSVVNKLTKKAPQPIGPKTKEKLIVEPAEASEVFSAHFADKAHNLRSDIPRTQKDDPLIRLRSYKANRPWAPKFRFKTVNEKTVLRHLKHAKATNSTSCDSINMEVLKKV